MGLLFSCLCGASFLKHTRWRDAQSSEDSLNHPFRSTSLSSHRRTAHNSSSHMSQSSILPSSLSSQNTHSPSDHHCSPFSPPALGSREFIQSDSRADSPSFIQHPADDTEHSARNFLPHTIPNSPVLSTEVLILGDVAMSALEAVRPRPPQKWPEPPQVQGEEDRPLKTLKDDELRGYFTAAIDAKNALHLRKEAATVDIGEALQALDPYLSIYDCDTAILQTIVEEINTIQEECASRSLMLNFYALERLRTLFPPYDQSLLEEHDLLFSSVGAVIEGKDSAHLAAHQFLHDPFSLREHRLPHLRTPTR